MAESAEELYARVTASTEKGPLPAPEYVSWDVFPWQVHDGAIVPAALLPPAPEPARRGEGGEDCPSCGQRDPETIVWQDDRWVLTHLGEPSGLPVVVMLHSREHLDLGGLSDADAARLGVLVNRIVRILESLPNVGRAHVSRWGDGMAHLHVWFFARTADLPSLRGSPAAEWDQVLPPVPEDRWRADLARLARDMDEVDGV